MEYGSRRGQYHAVVLSVVICSIQAAALRTMEEYTSPGQLGCPGRALEANSVQ